VSGATDEADGECTALVYPVSSTRAIVFGSTAELEALGTVEER